MTESLFRPRRKGPKFPPRLRFIEWWGRPAQASAQFQWEPRDLWIGVFWRFNRWGGPITGSDKHGAYRNPWSLHLYICFVPLVPLHIYVNRTVRP